MRPCLTGTAGVRSTSPPPAGGDYRVRLLLESSPEAYDRFYNIFANPMLWFIQHYLWDLSNAPDIRRNEIEAFEFGYNVVNEDLARAVVEEIEDVQNPVVMVHDYHLYTLPELVRRARPDVFLHHFVHIPWTQPDAWRVLPTRIRQELYAGLLANDIVGFHTQSYRRNFLQCCRELIGAQIDYDRSIVFWEGREVWVRAYPLPIDHAATRAAAMRPRVAQFEAELRRRRRDFMILRVDRADLSKNVLRGFSAFDTFLDQHPEYIERVTFVAQLMPSRTDVPQYQEYLERIEALVAVVNHRHGTPDWMPIQLKLRDDVEEAYASYRSYDVLLVNAMFDGMNLVAKEGPLLNENAGVSILSENTGAHDELGEYALSVNPFDIQELADSIHAALEMDPAWSAPAGSPGCRRSSPRATPANGSTNSSPTSRRRALRCLLGRPWRLPGAPRGHERCEGFRPASVACLWRRGRPCGASRAGRARGPLGGPRADRKPGVGCAAFAWVSQVACAPLGRCPGVRRGGDPARIAGASWVARVGCRGFRWYHRRPADGQDRPRSMTWC